MQKATDAFGLPQTAFDDECTNGAKNYCLKCQATLYPGQRYCGECRCDVLKRDAVYVKAGVMRRTIAEIIDRLAPLPFIVYFFPLWLIVIVLYGLLRESVFNSRSIGKKIMGLRVITLSEHSPCAWWQGLLRNILRTCAQLSYALVIFVPFALLYDFISFIAILIKKGRRLDDYMAGTMVINEEHHVKHSGAGT